MQARYSNEQLPTLTSLHADGVQTSACCCKQSNTRKLATQKSYMVAFEAFLRPRAMMLVES
jgi:hypothetical protein